MLNVVFPEEEGPAIVTSFISLFAAIWSAILLIFLWWRASFILINSGISPFNTFSFRLPIVDTSKMLFQRPVSWNTFAILGLSIYGGSSLGFFVGYFIKKPPLYKDISYNFTSFVEEYGSS